MERLRLTSERHGELYDLSVKLALEARRQRGSLGRLMKFQAANNAAFAARALARDRQPIPDWPLPLPGD